MKEKKKLREKFKDLSKTQKIQLVIASLLTLTLVIGIPVYAWFALSSRFESLTKIKAPMTLDIKSGHAHDIRHLDLSDIDANDSAGYKDYIFAVKAGNSAAYDIQIAHTTNIPFTYTLYRAKELGETSGTTGTAPSGSVATFEYFDEEHSQNITYYYGYASSSATTLTTVNTADEAKLTLTDLNPDNNSYGRILGKKSDDKNIYSGYTKYTGGNKPQIYAVPLYSQHTGIKTWNPNADYFILRLSWNTSAGGDFAEWNAATNNKETDMIYISAKASASQ